jgi:hypothetical protein
LKLDACGRRSTNQTKTCSNQRSTLFVPVDRPAASSDNWQATADQAAWITSYGLAPGNNLESGFALSPLRSYTTLVSGKNNETGVAMVEIYDEQ